MSERFRNLYQALGLALLAQGTLASKVLAIGPSDCAPGHADSTCAGRVGAPPTPGPSPAPNPTPPAPAPPPFGQSPMTLYDDAIALLPDGATAYWGFDFLSNAAGMPSPAPQDMYINRSDASLTLKFSFTVPTTHECGFGCLPRLELRVGPGWGVRYAPFTVSGATASASFTVLPHDFYAWVIGLEEASAPRLRVTADQQISLPLSGLESPLALATPVASTTHQCLCWDSSVAPCNYGTRYSSGLMGYWTDSWSYFSLDGWSDCPAKESG